MIIITAAYYSVNRVNDTFYFRLHFKTRIMCPSPSSIWTTIFCLSRWAVQSDRSLDCSCCVERLTRLTGGCPRASFMSNKHYESKKWFWHLTSWIAISGVVVRAVMVLGGRQLRALRENFHTSHLVNEVVKYSIYDLFLCPAYEKTRDTERLAATAKFKVIARKASKQQTKKLAGGIATVVSALIHQRLPTYLHQRYH